MEDKGERDSIASRYRAYIDCINNDSMETNLASFCHPHVIHNSRRLCLTEYRELIQASKDCISQLHFHIDTLLVDLASQKLAVRLLFTGTPIQPLAGTSPTGASVSFSEHVFYQLENGKISQVWSLVDWEAVRQQLHSEPHSGTDQTSQASRRGRDGT